MKRMAVCIAVLLVSTLAWAGSKTYQATGPVVDVRDDAIVIDDAQARSHGDQAGVSRWPRYQGVGYPRRQGSPGGRLPGMGRAARLLCYIA